MTLKELRQAKADKAREIAAVEAVQAKLRVEARGLFAITHDKRTEEQAGRLTAIDTELDTLAATVATLTDEASVIAVELQRAERYAEEAVQGGHVVETGVNHATERPWGPALHSDATTEMVADANVAALGEFGVAVYRASTGKGADPRLFAAATGMNTAIPSEGGFAVPEQVAPDIEREMYATGEILSRVDARTITGDSIAYNVIDETSRANGSRQGGVRAYWVDQGSAPTASETKLARIEMKLRKVGTLGYMTDELVADAAALGGELRSMFLEELQFATENAIFEGDGAGKPQGFTTANCLISITKETNQAAATIVGANITKMWARCPPRSQGRAAWLANIDCIPQLAELALPLGTAAVRYPYASVNNGAISLWGRPVIFVEHASTVGTVDDIVLADLSRYRLIRKGGVEQASSIHVKFTQGEETFRAFYRVDGQAVPRSAVTPFKGSNSTSPFITLATRS